MASANPSNVLPDGYDLSICILGETGCGKSTMVQSYITQRYPEPGTVPAVVDPQLLRRNAAPAFGDTSVAHDLASVNYKIIDTDGGQMASSSTTMANKLKELSPDVIILCYSHEDPQSLLRLASYWLPALKGANISKLGWPYVPVCLCGLKADLFESAAAGVWYKTYAGLRELLRAGEQTAASDDADVPLDEGASEHECWQACVAMLLIAWPDAGVLVQGEVSCSLPDHEAGLIGEVGDVLHTAAALAMHPTFPVFRPGVFPVFRPGVAAAGAAEDGDSVDPPGFAAACARAFRACDRDGDGLLSLGELAAFQKFTTGTRITDAEMAAVLASMRESSGGAASELVLEVAGSSFLTPAGLRQMFINFVLMSVNERVWQALQAFGYRLLLPSDAAAAPLRTWHNAEAAPAVRAAAAAGGGSLKQLCLTMPAHFADLDAAPLACPPDASLTLSSAGAAFLTHVFRVCGGASGGGTTLLPGAVQSLFDATPARSQPFSPLYPDATMHNQGGGVALDAWLNLWRMLAVTDPATALQALYALGFNRPAVEAGGSSGGGSAVAAAAAAGMMDFDPRWALTPDLPRKAPQHSPAGGAPAIRRVFVVGSHRCGKTSLVLHYVCQGKVGLSEHIARVSPSKSGPAPTTAPTHYVVKPTPLPGRDEVLPEALVITEWPADCVEAAMAEAASQCDAMVLVADLGSADSVAFLERAAQAVPDRVPCVVVGTRSAGGAGGGSVAAQDEGYDRLQELCQGHAAAAATGGDDKAGGAAAAASGGGGGLQLGQLFVFSPASKAALSRDLFEYVQYVALDCDGPGSPMTPERRQRVLRARRWQAAKAALWAGATLAGAALAGYVLYHAWPTLRTRWRQAVAGRKPALPAAAPPK